MYRQVLSTHMRVGAQAACTRLTYRTRRLGRAQHVEQPLVIRQLGETDGTWKIVLHVLKLVVMHNVGSAVANCPVKGSEGSERHYFSGIACATN